jgi:hypothetical protein
MDAFTWNDFVALQNVNSSSSNIAGDPTTARAITMPYTAASDQPGVTGVTDSLTGAVSNIFHSFTSGISTVINGVAQNYTNYLNGTQSPIGYDRYGQPIYQVVDPRTGALSTTTTPAWPGGVAGPGTYPERTPPSYSTGGVWGWLTNMLSIPAPTPQKSLGTVQPQTANPLTAPIVGGLSVAQIGLGLVAGYLVYRVGKSVV